MVRRDLQMATPQTSVREAARLMAQQQVGALLVVEGQKLVGIFTERDALFRVVAPGLDPDSTLLTGVMTRDPKTVAPNKSFGHAMHLMHKHGFRHLPVIENGRPIGIVSARDALDPDLEEFVAEARRREQFQHG
jgi:CBS domain-containing protein